MAAALPTGSMLANANFSLGNITGGGAFGGGGFGNIFAGFVDPAAFFESLGYGFPWPYLYIGDYPTGFFGDALEGLMKRHAYSVYLAVLAVTDLLNVLIRLIFYLNLLGVWLGYGYIVRPFVGPWSCAATSYVYYLVTALSNWMIIVVSVDRLVALVFPLAYLRLGSKSTAKKIIASMFTFTIIIWAYQLIPGVANHYIAGACLVKLATDFANVIFTTIALSHGSFLVIAIVNAIVIKTLRKNSAFGSNDKKAQATNRVTKLFLAISITFMICATPGAVLSTVYTIRPDLKIVGVIAEVMLLVWDASYSINFILYVFTSPEVREIVLKMFCCSGGGDK
ncbi:uncharacterized protein LOC141910633 [Tubulanus polymorphus]|uniref:uncharacterized protein LOC141910633 n=1 Tax=Tubulanus polymorphus TaxID=672921 RepID=UPI003DA533DA